MVRTVALFGSTQPTGGISSRPVGGECGNRVYGRRDKVAEVFVPGGREDRLQEKRPFIFVQAAFLVLFGLLLYSRDALPGGLFLVLTFLTLLIALWPRPVLWVDLSPYAILLLTYQSLRRFADGLEISQIHVTDLILWERRLTGGMPAATWRAGVSDTGLTPILDVAANLFYFSHFLVPIGLSLWLYRTRRSVYWPLLTVFFGLSYAGFLTYVLFPAAPPWWATERGFLHGAEAVTLEGFLLSREAMARTPDPLAAIPSMHCAFPLFWTLVVTTLKPSKSWPLWVLTGAVILSVVYLGHHYVVDVVAGLAYGFAAFPFAWRAIRKAAADSE